MSSQKPVLWNFFRSSTSWRVRIALSLKNIEYEYKTVNLYTDEQLTEEFGKLNPNQEIPVLEIDGNILRQSIAIIEYLDETRPSEPYIFPKDPAKRAKAMEIAEVINSGIQPYQNTNVLIRLDKDFGEDYRNKWVHSYLHKGYRTLERLLEESSGLYCIGDEITIADLCLVPQVYSARRFNIDLTSYSNLRRIYDELSKIPAFIKAHAHRQIDTYPELREE